jgi:para-aminobenzoate synthetase component 1
MLYFFKTDFHNAFERFSGISKTTRDWLFGYLSYDLKNDLVLLSKILMDSFSDLFFQPKKLFNS